jgi:hypothetical protein
LAQQILRGDDATSERRLESAFQLVVGRRPTSAELSVLADGFRYHQAIYRQDPSLAKALLRTGDYAIDVSVDEADLAAYTVVTNLILNLDEAVTKE